MQCLGINHAISGAMRQWEKTATDGINRHTDTQTVGHCDSKTKSAKWANLVKMDFPDNDRNLNPELNISCLRLFLLLLILDNISTSSKLCKIGQDQTTLKYYLWDTFW